MKLLLMFVVAALLCCTACVPRPEVALPLAEAETRLLTPDAELARFIGQSSEGAAATFSGTRLGSTAGVTVGGAYTSALGLFCRRAQAFTGGMARQRIAACQEAGGRWVLAPGIFADGAI